MTFGHRGNGRICLGKGVPHTLSTVGLFPMTFINSGNCRVCFVKGDPYTLSTVAYSPLTLDTVEMDEII